MNVNEITTVLLPLINNNQQCLLEAHSLLSTLEQHQYCAVQAPFKASVGQHMRHVLGHYHCLLDGVLSQQVRDTSSDIVINYDQRTRGDACENSIIDCLQQIERVNTRLNLVANQRIETSNLKIIQATDCEQPSVVIESNMSRELVFLHSHTTHHYALIQAILSLQGINTSNHFGVAPSTISHEKQCAQ